MSCIGMYLSETEGQFWLDRRKFLLRKKQLGEKEDSPTFLLLCKFCASQMFELFVKGRIDDMGLTSRDRYVDNAIIFLDLFSDVTNGMYLIPMLTILGRASSPITYHCLIFAPSIS